MVALWIYGRKPGSARPRISVWICTNMAAIAEDFLGGLLSRLLYPNTPKNKNK